MNIGMGLWECGNVQVGTQYVVCSHRNTVWGTIGATHENNMWEHDINV